MLTVDFDRLGLRPGDRLLDLGCGFGRHAFEGFRRGGHVVACDLAVDELRECMALFAAMRDQGEAPGSTGAAAVRGNALHLPYADGAFDRIIASEVLEHIDDDAAALAELVRVLAPGGTMAVTVPAWLAERFCWSLSEQYHAPFVDGGHVRIYTKAKVRDLLRASGLHPAGAHRAHALHTPYWWLKCAVGPTDDDHRLVRLYHRLLVWDITKRPRLTRFTERALNPVLGKSLVVYATKPDHPETGPSSHRARTPEETEHAPS